MRCASHCDVKAQTPRKQRNSADPAGASDPLPLRKIEGGKEEARRGGNGGARGGAPGISAGARGGKVALVEGAPNTPSRGPSPSR